MNWGFGLNYGKICVPLAIWLKTTAKHWKIKTNKQNKTTTTTNQQKQATKTNKNQQTLKTKKTTLINYKKQKQRNEQKQPNKNGF